MLAIITNQKQDRERKTKMTYPLFVPENSASGAVTLWNLPILFCGDSSTLYLPSYSGLTTCAQCSVFIKPTWALRELQALCVLHWVTKYIARAYNFACTMLPSRQIGWTRYDEAWFQEAPGPLQREQIYQYMWLRSVRKTGAAVSRAYCGPTPVLGIKDFPEGRLEPAEGPDRAR